MACTCGNTEPVLSTFSPGDNADNGRFCEVRCTQCGRKTAAYSIPERQKAFGDWDNGAMLGG
jgi:hypothetical protein